MCLSFLVGGSTGCLFDESGLPYATDAAVDPDVVGIDVHVDPDADAGPELCGNGTVNQGEACDGDDFGGMTCVTLGFTHGELSCTAACVLNSSGCHTCGDGVVELGEQCDATDLAGADCQDLGFSGGVLGCGADCQFDTSACSATDCGNGVLDASELCDSGNLNGESCPSLGFTGGMLTCDASCEFDTSACTLCGDSVRAGSEACDGTDLAGATCQSRGHDAGTLACDNTCSFDESLCSDCGNGVLEALEPCDGTLLGGATCQTEGFHGGTLACDAACGLDVSLCTVCGDGQLDPAEECDDGTQNSDVDPDACRSDCVLPYCGDGVCDTADHNLACTDDCAITIFTEGFESGWPNGWVTWDALDGLLQDLVDTWQDSTLDAHSGSRSCWCAENGSNSSSYDNNMDSWAVRSLNLSPCVGMQVFLDVWIWVDTSETDDWFSMVTSNDNGASWPNLEVFNGWTQGWVFRSYDISYGAGNTNFGMGMRFRADGDSPWGGNDRGALVDDIVVWCAP